MDTRILQLQKIGLVHLSQLCLIESNKFSNLKIDEALQNVAKQLNLVSETKQYIRNIKLQELQKYGKLVLNDAQCLHIIHAIQNSLLFQDKNLLEKLKSSSDISPQTISNILSGKISTDKSLGVSEVHHYIDELLDYVKSSASAIKSEEDLRSIVFAGGKNLISERYSKSIEPFTGMACTSLNLMMSSGFEPATIADIMATRLVAHLMLEAAKKKNNAIDLAKASATYDYWWDNSFITGDAIIFSNKIGVCLVCNKNQVWNCANDESQTFMNMEGIEISSDAPVLYIGSNTIDDAIRKRNESVAKIKERYLEQEPGAPVDLPPGFEDEIDLVPGHLTKNNISQWLEFVHHDRHLMYVYFTISYSHLGRPDHIYPTGISDKTQGLLMQINGNKYGGTRNVELSLLNRKGIMIGIKK